MSDERVIAAIVQVLMDEGAEPGNSLHSWRCEYPDRYGPCDCLQQTAQLIAQAIEDAQSNEHGAALAKTSAAAVRLTYAWEEFWDAVRALERADKGDA